MSLATSFFNLYFFERDVTHIVVAVVVAVLWAMGTLLHDVRDSWQIPSNCPCQHRPTNQQQATKDSTPRAATPNGFASNHATRDDDVTSDKLVVNGLSEGASKHMNPLSLLAEAAVSRDHQSTTTTKTEPLDTTDAKSSTLRDLLTRQGLSAKGAAAGNGGAASEKMKKKNIDDILAKFNNNDAGSGDSSRSVKLTHYVPRGGHRHMKGRDSPIPTYTLEETTVLFPDVKHSWLDDGRLLRLHDPASPHNMHLFQQQWRRGQPVLVSNCHQRLDERLWTPRAFGEEFGHAENDLINCLSLATLSRRKMRVFWDGFEHISSE